MNADQYYGICANLPVVFKVLTYFVPTPGRNLAEMSLNLQTSNFEEQLSLRLFILIFGNTPSIVRMCRYSNTEFKLD